MPKCVLTKFLCVEDEDGGDDDVRGNPRSECARCAALLSDYKVTHLLGKKPPIDLVPTVPAAGGSLM